MHQIIKNIDGKDVGFLFTMITVQKICEAMDIELWQFLESMRSNPFSMINVSLQKGNEVFTKGKAVTEYEVDAWIESMSDEDLEQIWETFKNGFASAFKRLNTLNEEKVKKK